MSETAKTAGAPARKVFKPPAGAKRAKAQSGVIASPPPQPSVSSKGTRLSAAALSEASLFGDLAEGPSTASRPLVEAEGPVNSTRPMAAARSCASGAAAPSAKRTRLGVAPSLPAASKTPPAKRTRLGMSPQAAPDTAQRPAVSKSTMMGLLALKKPPTAASK